MYRIIESSINIKTRYCIIKRTKEDTFEYDYLAANHTDKQNVNKTLTDRYIYLDDVNMSMIYFNKYEGYYNLFKLIKPNKITATININNIDQDVYETYKCKYNVNKEDIKYSIKSIIKEDDKSKEETIQNKLAYAFLFRSILKCPIDFSKLNESLQLYFKSKINSLNLPDHVIYVMSGPIYISRGINVNMVLDVELYDNNDIPIIPSINILLNIADAISNMSIVPTIQPQNVQSNILNSSISSCDDHVQPKKRTKLPKNKIDNNGNSLILKFYKGFNINISKLDEFINEIEYILNDILPLHYLDNFTTWIRLASMCTTIGLNYNCMLQIENIFDIASRRSNDKYNKIENQKYWELSKLYTVHPRYIYTIIINEGIYKLDEESLESQIETLMYLYTFKYFKCINKLVYREECTHYYECDELATKRLFFNLYRGSMTSMKTYIQNLIYNIEARAQLVESRIYEYKNILPFTDYIFDLDSKSLKMYTNQDYILYDVGYNFPYTRYNECENDYDKFVNSSICLKHISEMFINIEEENMFWQSMCENLNRQCKYDSIIIFFGSKSNGKGTIFRLNSFAFGDLDVAVGTKYLEKRQSTGPEPEFYNLLYTLFATIPDFTNTQMSSDRLKMTSTGDKMTFRRLYANEYISFIPAYSTIIGCNVLPRFTVYDGGIRRRLVIIPFRVSFSPNLKRRGDIFKLADPSVREQFGKNCEWRNDYIINLIHHFYMPRKQYDCSEHLRLVDAVNNRFLAFLFDKYKINDSSDEKYMLDTIITEYQRYLSDFNVRVSISKERIEEVLLTFDIAYDTDTGVINGLERIIKNE